MQSLNNFALVLAVSGVFVLTQAQAAEPAGKPKEAGAKQSQASTATSTEAFSTVPSTVPADAQAIERAREAMRKEIQALSGVSSELAGTNAVTAASERKAAKGKTAPVQPQQGGTNAPAASAKKPAAQAAKPAPQKAGSQFTPLQAPDLGITAEQKDKLAELLRRYRADEITPEEYHQERAKVLSGKQ